MVPYDDRSPFVTSGIRVGTAAITTRGLIGADCEQVVEWIDAALMNAGDDVMLNDICKKVNAMMDKFPLYA
jgi:glycine hydroxymethyltransferase